MNDDVSALILAGGRGSRMGGVDKSGLVIDGETIFERQTRVLRPLVTEVIVSSPRGVDGYRAVRDVPDAVGPLAGIAAGLEAVTTVWLLVIAGDMPHVTSLAIGLLLGRSVENGPRPSPGEVVQPSSFRALEVLPPPPIEAVAFRINGRPEPLISLLRVAPAKRAANELIAQGQMRAAGLLEALRVAWVEESELRAVDPELEALRNINTPADL